MDIGGQFETTTLAWVLAGLFLFGVGYNWFVAWLERDGRDRGYTAILVVAGVAITVIGFGHLAGTEAAIAIFYCFSASGTPMIVGSIWRHVSQRAREEKQLLDCAKRWAEDD